MLKTAENLSENRRIFDGFLAILSIFETPTVVWNQKSDPKNHKKYKKHI